MEKFFKVFDFSRNAYSLYNPRQLFQNDIVSIDNIYILATSHELFVKNMKTNLILMKAAVTASTGK